MLASALPCLALPCLAVLCWWWDDKIVSWASSQMATVMRDRWAVLSRSLVRSLDYRTGAQLHPNNNARYYYYYSDYY